MCKEETSARNAVNGLGLQAQGFTGIHDESYNCLRDLVVIGFGLTMALCGYAILVFAN